jgi:hypothetical protein
MKTKHRILPWLALLALAFVNLQPSTLLAQGTAFSYQGQLYSGGAPANGSYDLTFTLFDTNPGDVAIAGPLTNTATAVNNGLFTVTLDFGPGVFSGASRWLEIGVRTNGGGSFTTLAPLQPVLPAPYAVMANNASNLLGNLPSARLSGPIPASQLSGLVPLAQLPGAVVTNNAAGISLNGTFSGNGAGLTGVPGSIPWVNGYGTSQQAQPNTGYIASNAALVSITLPAAPNLGDIVSVSGVGSGGWQTLTWQLSTNQYLFTGYETNITLPPGTYDITAYGAQGGIGGVSNGGQGAEMEGEFSFSGLTTLTLLVGGAGGVGSDIEGCCGGGGGGVAGGGGGGFLGNGNSSLNCGGGSSFIAGGAGGSGYYGGGGNGGYGGGGGGQWEGPGGGGGGYSGGGGGDGSMSPDYSGGGGGSYIAPSAIGIGTELPSVKIDNGEVDIVAMSPVVVSNFAGGQNSAIELQYVGNGQWQPLNSVGTISAFLGGCNGNSIQTNAYQSFLGGGGDNSIQTGAHDSFLGGGETNSIQGGRRLFLPRRRPGQFHPGGFFRLLPRRRLW